MSADTKIEWTDATWNVVTGCEKVSPGCDRCYAETFAERWRGIPGHHFENGFDVTLRPERLTLPLRWRKPKRVFVNSMSDLFHKDIPDEYIAQVFAIMALTPQHTYQVLTKRHGRMRSLVGSPDFEKLVDRALLTMPAASDSKLTGRSWPLPKPGWPLPNVWLGVSVEDQKRADLRVPALVDTPAAVRFLSCEPLLGPVDLTAWMPEGFASWRCQGPDCLRFYSGPLQQHCPDCGREGHWTGSHTGNGRPNGQPIGWVIVGGESGHGARAMHPDWARSLREQTTAAAVPFFMKQWGEWGPAPFIVRVCDPDVGWKGTEEELAAAKADSEARGATHVHTGNWWDEDGQRQYEVFKMDHKPWSLERVGLPDGMEPIRRWGKKNAGRDLDGRTWDEFPKAAS